MATKKTRSIKRKLENVQDKIGEEVEGLEEKGEELVHRVERELPKVKRAVDTKIHTVEDYIRKEPLTSVTASFLLGIFIGGRMMK